MRKRFNTIEILLIAILISPALIFVCRAEEQITITTYYPAPNGIYKRMSSDQMSVGPAYRTSTVADGDIVISGSVGIGSNNTPVAGKLDVVMNDGSRVTINNTDSGIDMRSTTATYIDLSNDFASNYDMRLYLIGDDDLGITGGRTTLSNEDGTPAVLRVGEVWFCADYS